MTAHTSMESLDRDLVAGLNELIEACTDGEMLYATASAEVQDESLRQVLRGYCSQRAGFVRELQQAIRARGATPENEGTLRGRLHRALLELREALEIRKDKLVLEECVHADRVALAAYERVGRKLVAAPPELRALFEQHVAAMRASLDRVSQF